MKLKCVCGNSVKFIGKRDNIQTDFYCRICGSFIKSASNSELNGYSKEYNLKIRGVK